MRTKPFLTNFAELLKSSDYAERVKLVYNESLDYNEFSEVGLNPRSSFLQSSTTNAIKGEYPDNAKSLIRDYMSLASKTITEVKAEKPDVHSAYWNTREFMMAQTTTRIKGETSDK